MNVVVTGAAGFLGRRLATKLLDLGELDLGRSVTTRIENLMLFDVVKPEQLPDDSRVKVVVGDLTNRTDADQLVTREVDAVFHLAAVVSGAAEENFDLGYSVNLDGTRNLLEAARHHGARPRFVFAGTTAEYGGELPDVVPDTFYLNPQNSYGVQKACSELLVKDYSRKGFIDGRIPRLPTIVVRGGKPNKAASAFASSIIREPLSGSETVCPVTPDGGIFVLSPRRVIDNLIHAVELPPDAFGFDRAFMLPGLSTTVGELVAALERVAGKQYSGRIRWERDERIQTIVSGWPPDFESRHARELGFTADAGVDEIIRQFIEDELGQVS